MAQVRDDTANPWRGEASLVVAGAAQVLRPSFAALVAAEEELGPGARERLEPRGGGRGGNGRRAGGKRQAAARAADADIAGRGVSGGADEHPVEAAFGPGARRLAGLAGRLLGWRPGEFWAATPAELIAILAPEPGIAAAPLTRDEMNRMMEADNG